MYRLFTGEGAVASSGLTFFAYCAIAFGLQAPIGDFLDRRRGAQAALLGFALIAAGLVVCFVIGTWVDGGGALILAWAAICLVGFGNALFHAEGGIDSLVNAGGRLSRSGVFVSSGAMGVGLGALAGSGKIAALTGGAGAAAAPDPGLGAGGIVSEALPLALIAFSFIVVSLFRYRGAEFGAGAYEPYFGTVGTAGAAGTAGERGAPRKEGHSFSLTSKTSLKGFAPALLFIAVIIRAYGGGLIQAPWKPEYLLLPAASACAGKAAGGFLADRFGARTIGWLPLAACIPLLSLAYGVPALGAAGIFLFNAVMPVTLCAISDRIPGSPGLAFGTASLALLVGTVPHYLPGPAPGTALVILPLLCAAAAIILFNVIRKRTKDRDSGTI